MMRIGCCGYTVAKSKYHDSLDVVELPQTFFQPPSPRVLSSWRDGAPAGFEFVVRAWQLITHDPMSPTYDKLKNPIPDFKRLSYGHFRPTGEVWRAWEATEKAARILKAKVVVFQTPPNFKPSAESADNMRSFFGMINGRGLTYVWDARGWRKEDALALSDELGLVCAADPFRATNGHLRKPSGSITYLRLPGRGGFRYCYNDDEVRDVLERYAGVHELYVIFDNSYMYDNARALKKYAAAAAPDGLRPVP